MLGQVQHGDIAQVQAAKNEVKYTFFLVGGWGFASNARVGGGESSDGSLQQNVINF